VPRAGNRTVWVLVADEALARILRWDADSETLDDVEAVTDPAAHAKEGDFQRDSAGRRAGVAPQGSRQNTQQHRLRGTSSITASAGEEDQHLEAQSFARRVAAHLAAALQQKRFDELRVVAAPRFLGYLRKELDAHVKATVSDELSKDLIHEGNGALAKRLFGGEVDDAAAR
jgi:protein required for attachment to host cells